MENRVINLNQEILSIDGTRTIDEYMSEASGRKAKKAARVERRGERKVKRKEFLKKAAGVIPIVAAAKFVKRRKEQKEDRVIEKLRALGATDEQIALAPDVIRLHPNWTAKQVFKRVQQLSAKPVEEQVEEEQTEEGVSDESTDTTDTTEGGGEYEPQEEGEEEYEEEEAEPEDEEYEESEPEEEYEEDEEYEEEEGEYEGADGEYENADGDEYEDADGNEYEDADGGEDDYYGFDETFSEFEGEDFSEFEANPSLINPKVQDVANKITWHKEKIKRLQNRLNMGGLTAAEENMLNDQMDSCKMKIAAYENMLNRYHGGLKDDFKPKAFRTVRAAKYLAEKERGRRLYPNRMANRGQMRANMQAKRQERKQAMMQQRQMPTAQPIQVVTPPSTPVELKSGSDGSVSSEMSSGEDVINFTGKMKDNKMPYIIAGIAAAGLLIWANNKYKFIKL